MNQPTAEPRAVRRAGLADAPGRGRKPSLPLAHHHASHPSASLWDVLRQWLEVRFRRPAVALAYVTVLMGVGLTTGYWHAQSDAAQAHSELKARYLQAVDPLQR